MAKLYAAGIMFDKKETAKRLIDEFVRVPPPRKLDGLALELVTDLLTRHPDYEVIAGPGIAEILIVWNVDHYTTAVLRTDGTQKRFGLNTCLRGTLKTNTGRIYSAFRTAVNDQIVEYKQRYFAGSDIAPSEVSKTEMAWNNCEVDHVVDFKTMVGQFIEASELTIANIDIEKDRTVGQFGGDHIKDQQLLMAWQAFHQARAQLRCITKMEHDRKTHNREEDVQ